VVVVVAGVVGEVQPPAQVLARVLAEVEVVDESLWEGEGEGQAMKNTIDQFWAGTLRVKCTASQSASSGSSSSLDASVAAPTLVAIPAPTPKPTAAGAFHFGAETVAGLGVKLEALLRASSSAACFFASACLSLHVIPVLLTGGLAGCCCSCSASCARLSNGLTSLLGLGS